MSSIRDLNTLPLASSAIEKLQECGFRSVGELKGVQPLDLARELDVSADLANQVSYRSDLKVAIPLGGWDAIGHWVFYLRCPGLLYDLLYSQYHTN